MTHESISFMSWKWYETKLPKQPNINAIEYKNITEIPETLVLIRIKDKAR